MRDKPIAGAPGAGIIVGPLPNNFLPAPLTSTLPPFAIDSSLHVILVGGNPIPLFADLGGGTFGPLPAGSVVPLSALTDLAPGFGLPPALQTIPPFSALPHVGAPPPDTDSISPAPF